MVDTRVHWDTRDVEVLLTRANYAMSGHSLAGFMRTVVDPYMRRRAKERFAGEGDSAVGGRWYPLREHTVLIRVLAGFPGRHPINRRTGELENFITGTDAAVVQGDAQAILTLPGSQPQGELLDKLRTAQRGRKVPNTMPRPVLGVDQTDLVTVMRALESDLMRKMDVGL